MNTYDYHPLIARIAARYCRIYGGDFDDAVQNAWAIFLECRKTYDPARGSLEARAQYVIFNGLRRIRLSNFRTRRRELVRRAPVPDLDLEKLFSDLSDNAASVAKIIFSMPKKSRVTTALVKTLGRRAGLQERAVFAALREIGAALV